MRKRIAPEMGEGRVAEPMSKQHAPHTHTSLIILMNLSKPQSSKSIEVDVKYFCCGKIPLLKHNAVKTHVIKMSRRIALEIGEGRVAETNVQTARPIHPFQIDSSE
ncbi:MAG: hypothetical protein N0C90_22650 [Candidatus Thiodiazotropha endolucinida]|nr:hypothetical protein [Candidatus Thiodiazotropha taylori]MCW4264156.1 hypothetical protein [Candidatus Thiodiazotropha endolucinida]